jgi:hypothetical protein
LGASHRRRAGVTPTHTETPRPGHLAPVNVRYTPTLRHRGRVTSPPSVLVPRQTAGTCTETTGWDEG